MYTLGALCKQARRGVDSAAIRAARGVDSGPLWCGGGGGAVVVWRGGGVVCSWVLFWAWCGGAIRRGDSRRRGVSRFGYSSSHGRHP